jgi:hypothetical protein
VAEKLAVKESERERKREKLHDTKISYGGFTFQTTLIW